MNKAELREIEERLSKAQKGPWKAFIEGRDHQSGSHFIQTGENDIELDGAKLDDYDFIAHARQDIPLLIAELKKLKGWE